MREAASLAQKALLNVINYMRCMVIRVISKLSTYDVNIARKFASLGGARANS